MTISRGPSRPILQGLQNSESFSGQRLPSINTIPFLPIYQLFGILAHYFRFLNLGRMLATFTFTTDIIFRNLQFIGFFIAIKYQSILYCIYSTQYIYITKMAELSEPISFDPNQPVIDLLKNPKINAYSPEYVAQILSRESLLKIEDVMKVNKSLKVTSFLRLFRQILPFERSTHQTQFFIYYALFKLFSQICNIKKKTQVNFSDISSYLAEKMPNYAQQTVIQEKLLPFGLNIHESVKANILSPEVYGAVAEDRCFFSERPIKSDKIQHIHREVGQSEYSKKSKIYYSIDRPSTIISILDDNFDLIGTLKTEKQMTKRDMIVTNIAWSETEEKIACILGNYSISIWSKQDNYKYEVNIPLPSQYLANPFIVIKYMYSMKKWITLDNRPAVYILDNKNYQPESIFLNPKIRKKKQSQKFQLQELEYLQMLCIGFQRNLFLISLKHKQIVSEITNLRTSITSIAFSQSYQALFVSTYDEYFRSFELSEFHDLVERGRFEGHKSLISLLGVIQKKPIVFSVQQNSILKLFDLRNYTCYQSISVLKNIIYRQILYLEEAICLVGSKMHVYGIQKELAYKQKELVKNLGIINKNLLIVTNKNIRIYDINNGALKSVIKPNFKENQSSQDIILAYVLASKQKFFVLNEEGETIILDTQQISEVKTWKFQPKPSYIYYDQTNDLLTEVSLGCISIYQFNNQLCQKELRRQISNQTETVRLIKVCSKHDLILIAYQGDDCLYFYSYEKVKMLGYLYLGKRKVVKFKNAYKPQKTIPRIIDFDFFETKNVIIILLYDQILFYTYRRSLSSMSFLLKKSVKLWEKNLTLWDGQKYHYKQQDEQEPLHSTGFAQFQSSITVTSNKMTIISNITHQVDKMEGVEEYVINKDNYNASRTAFEVHTGTGDTKNPMVSITDLSNTKFNTSYFLMRKKLGEFVLKSKIGNLLVVADNQLNIVVWQYPKWHQISAILNCGETLPYFWNCHKYSQQEIRQAQFIKQFIVNEQTLPEGTMVKSLIQTNFQKSQSFERNLSKITMSQLLQQDKRNNTSKGYRSRSLREKKMTLQKQRQQREKYQLYLEQKVAKNRQKQASSQKNFAQKQINDILGYFSLNHNETILKKGMVQEELPAVKVLERKLLASVNKSDKKSLVSLGSFNTFKSNQQSLKSLRKSQAKASMQELQNLNTVSSQQFVSVVEKLGIQTYNSRQLIKKLNIQKSESQRKLKPLFRDDDKFPKLKS